MDGMVNLFGDEFTENGCEQNACAAEKPAKAKGKKSSTSGGTTTITPKLTDDSALEVRSCRVKIYNEFYDYVVPEDKETPTIGDVRQWLVGQGYTELTKDRATFVWVTPEEGEKFLVAGVKFEKQG
ncbi:hypothetical protein [Syntrophomonas palmitatica]|uniref:hypothetical protein n=1 Tax=Syntrophomonas palmitatica TaxID=402877 RepID=UPI0006CF9542|nr:hypothetical protein [Syntrophomonas palmitatica]